MAQEGCIIISMKKILVVFLVILWLVIGGINFFMAEHKDIHFSDRETWFTHKVVQQ